MSSSPMTSHGAPSWIEHHGPDATAARRFYERVLDWRVNDLPMKDGSAYPGILVGDRPVGGFSPRPRPDGGWLVYVTVDDVDRRFAAAITAGATALSGPIDAAGVGRIGIIRDPFGGVLAMIAYESANA